jgi:hypothetical protein
MCITISKGAEMTTGEAKPDRLTLFSDAVFAVIITILVLELRPPHSPSFAALVSLWPTAMSYAVSYLFIAIVWINHHHLMRYADTATPSLVWEFCALIHGLAHTILDGVDRGHRSGRRSRSALRRCLRARECDLCPLVL